MRDDFTGFKEIKIIATVCNLCSVITFSVKIYKCGDKLFEASCLVIERLLDRIDQVLASDLSYIECYSEKGDG